MISFRIADNLPVATKVMQREGEEIYFHGYQLGSPATGGKVSNTT